jgi:hypothetical protein
MCRPIWTAAVGGMPAVTFALGAPQASVAQTFAAPPEGFTREGSFGPAATCESRGVNGTAEGKRNAYLYHRELPLTPFVYLYVKK